jgi:predicted Zn-dependent protease
MDSGPENTSAPPGPAGSVVYFDGTSSRRHMVTLAFNGQLEINASDPTLADHALAAWSYADIRRADSPSGTLRLTCLTAPALARLEIRDAALSADLIARCTKLDENLPGRRGVAAIVGWSLAATASIIVVVLFGVPLAADRLTPLFPPALERRLGDVAEGQVKILFGNKICTNASGQAAFNKLVDEIRGAADLDVPIQTAVLSTPIPNAFALPGGKVYLFDGLLAKAENADEIAGVLAHELGHLKHRDNTRNLIYNGGTSFLIGLLFGDVTGSGALIFASRALITASYTREAEQNADTFSIKVMHRLGRSPKPMGELLFRVTGKQVDKTLSVLSNHPLTEDRLKRMSDEDRPLTGPPLLTSEEWTSLKAICSAGKGSASKGSTTRESTTKESITLGDH